MTTSIKIREQIDACRAGSSDLASPALAELAEAASRDPAIAAELARSQEFDASLRAALNDLPVPAALEDRLLAEFETNPAADGVSVPQRAAESARLSRRGFSFMRRRLLVVGGSLALVSLIAVSAYQSWRASHRHVGQDELAVMAAKWRSSLLESGWSPAKLPANAALDPALRNLPYPWQSIDKAQAPAWAKSVTAVNLASAGSPGAVLFIVRSSAKLEVPSKPTTTWQLTFSGGFKATAWQRPGSKLLYVLVIEEKNGQRLEHYLRPSAEA